MIVNYINTLALKTFILQLSMTFKMFKKKYFVLYIINDHKTDFDMI